jgi:hypothetical protein
MRHCIGKQRNRLHPSDSHLDESFETIHGPELGEEHMVQNQKALGISLRNLGDPWCLYGEKLESHKSPTRFYYEEK